MTGSFILIVASLLFAAASPAGPEDGGSCSETAFQERCARLALNAEKAGTITVAGDNGWLFLGPELRHIGAGRFWGEEAAGASRARNPEHADPLPAILDFNEQLEERGVELLVVPVPSKAVVYPDRLPGGRPDVIAENTPPRLDAHERAFFDILESEGIRVLDLFPLFSADRDHFEGPVYCRQDSHWSGVGCLLAAGRIADEIRERPWYDSVEKQSFAAEWVNVAISGDLWRELKAPAPERESLRLRRVGTPSESGLRPVDPEPSSPVLLLGDSHNLVFHAGGDMHARSAGLADQLAYKLGFAVDLVGVRGSGATPARINLFRRAQNQPDYWDAKRIVVWCFSVREFTQSDGWRKVPVAQ